METGNSLYFCQRGETMKKFCLVVVLICLVSSFGAAKSASPLWQKKLDKGFLIDLEVANSGKVVLLHKPHKFGKVVDLVICNQQGRYEWNHRLTTKVKDFAFSTSGKRLVYTRMQPKQVKQQPVITFIAGKEEKWSRPGGRKVSFAGGQEYILSFNQGVKDKGIFLYTAAGELIWRSSKLSLEAGQVNQTGNKIYGIKDNQIKIININLNTVENYSWNREVFLSAFDVKNKQIFIYDGKNIVCFDEDKGQKWKLAVPDVYKLTTDSVNQKLTAYTEETNFKIYYDKDYYNQHNVECQLLKKVDSARKKYSFSNNGNYLVDYTAGKLRLYKIGGNKK